MQRIAIALAIAACGACGSDSSSGHDAGPAQHDAPGTTSMCATAANSQVASPAASLTFADLGNTSSDPEVGCSSGPDTVVIVLATDAARDDASTALSFELALPLVAGTYPVTLTGAGTTSYTGSVTVTKVVLAGGGPGVTEVDGTLAGTDVKGPFSATACGALSTC